MELVGLVLVVGFLVLVVRAVGAGRGGRAGGDDDDQGVDWAAEYRARTEPRLPRPPAPAPDDDLPPDLREVQGDDPSSVRGTTGSSGDPLLDDVPDYLREPGGQQAPDARAEPVREPAPGPGAAGPSVGEARPTAGAEDADLPAAPPPATGPAGPVDVGTWICVRADDADRVVSALALREVRTATWADATARAASAPADALRGRRPLAVSAPVDGWVVVAGRLLGRGTSDDVGWLSQVLGEAHLFASDGADLEVWERWDGGRAVRRHRRVPGEKPVDVGEASSDRGTTPAEVAASWSVPADRVPGAADARLGTG